jgi:hypothetical protein
MTPEEFLRHLKAHAETFAKVYDDYWMFYLTRDMAQTLSMTRPYTNLKTYQEYKERGVDTLRAHEKEIVEAAEGEAGNAEEESE